MTTDRHIRSIELLAPAHDLDAGCAAIDCGADAVYIGGPGFGARLSAGNNIGDIARLVNYARRFRVRIYAALNTLIYEDELKEAEKTAKELINAGVDALIVQDMSFMRMQLPDVEMHASTQICNTTPDKVRFLGESGFSRVILERGLTFDEIKSIRKSTNIDLECFVHGAICVGFSGQCYMSRSMCNRSGNRGDCSQPCRLTYDLLDGQRNVILKGKHLLSVLDLNLSERIPQLIDAGITSFKIEGRLKDTNYVRNVVGYYRTIIDQALASRPELCRSSSGRTIFDFDPDPARSFSRGSTTWMFDGKRKGQASFSTPKATGEYIGKVKNIRKNSFQLDRPITLHSGDGICFMCGGELTGTNINNIEGTYIYPNKMTGISPGTDIYRNYDHIFNTRLAHSKVCRVVDINMKAAISDKTIILTADDREGNTVSVKEPLDFGNARESLQMTGTIRKQLSKLGDTIFRTSEIVVEKKCDSTPFIPVSKLNELRRKATDQLLEKRLENHKRSHKKAENISFPYPEQHISGETSITNSLARSFYTDHGVETIEEPFEMLNSLSGKCVMRSAYCLRRELGECLREGPTLKGPLRLRRGAITWLLDFDCQACRMNIIKE